MPAAIPIHMLRARLMEAETARRSAERALAAARAREAAIAAPREPSRKRLDDLRVHLAAVTERQATDEKAVATVRHEIVICDAQRAQIAKFLKALDPRPCNDSADEC